MDAKVLYDRKRRVRKMIVLLKKLYPKAYTVLQYSKPFELLVAVVLSAQCTDKMVNKVTSRLFQKYKSIDDYAHANQAEFERDIKSTGFYRNKAKNILNCARIIQNQYQGKVPNTMEDILKLPGIARKSANIILYNLYGKIEGVAVDTHVGRLANVYSLTDYKDPVKIERDLMKILPKTEWMDFTYRMVFYGREYCTARKHDHANCPLVNIH